MPVRGASMIGYYVEPGWRSCRRSKALTSLVMLSMDCGVATCMVTYAVFRATSADLIPGKSSQLFVPQIDNFGSTNNNAGEPFGVIAMLPATQSMPSFFSL